ncbi:hypothetical protein [Spirosoma sp. KNUC1025]|uniref:hypothetical protein n=1 Tax=Spirosoma sp. KNUC1025 TaxID=2894082 RepID=UPI0038657895|nr:hypothetical protein LN737_04585 [Spirosoma sp. KNUC1025]
MKYLSKGKEGLKDSYARLDPQLRALEPNGDSLPTKQLLAAGWGYCTLETSSIQADNGAGLTRGIVSEQRPAPQVRRLGRPTRLGLGSSRALNYLQVNARQVGIEGVCGMEKQHWLRWLLISDSDWH